MRHLRKHEAKQQVQHISKVLQVHSEFFHCQVMILNGNRYLESDDIETPVIVYSINTKKRPIYASPVMPSNLFKVHAFVSLW